MGRKQPTPPPNEPNHVRPTPPPPPPVPPPSRWVYDDDRLAKANRAELKAKRKEK